MTALPHFGRPHGGGHFLVLVGLFRPQTVELHCGATR